MNTISLCISITSTALVFIVAGMGLTGCQGSKFKVSAASHNAMELCGKLAPEDPYQPQAGDQAYTACKAASDSAPNDPETQYRLALSAIQLDRIDEGVVKLKEAAALGHCGANFFLGDQAWHGANDIPAAEEFYNRAAACGDERAKQQVFTPEFFERSAYPQYLSALYRSDIAAINEADVRFVSASYVAGFYEALSEQFLGPDFNPCWAATYFRGGDVLYQLQAAEKGDAPNIIESYIYEKSLPLLYRLLFPEQGTGALEERRHALRKAGHADLIRMVKQSECGALAPFKMERGVTEFAAAKKSLWETARTKLPGVNSMDDLARLLKGSENRPK